MTATIGQKLTVHPVYVADFSSGTQRAYVANQSSQTIIVFRLNAYAGYKLGSSPAHLRLGLGSTAGTNPDPAALLASTSDITLSSVMDESTGGAVVSADLSTPQLCRPGFYALVGAVTGDAWLGELAASQINGQNDNFYTKTGLSSNIPTNPIGGTAAIEGQLGIWAEGDLNVAPHIPANLSPSGVQTSGVRQPVMWGDFADDNQTLSNGAAWDYIAASQIQVIRQSDGHVMWDHTEASGPTQQAESKTQITYNGEALATDGTVYTYKLRQQDRAGAWSLWASTTFSIAPAGSVAAPTGPTGKQSTVEPGPFTAVYTHQTSLSANAVQVQLFLDGQPFTTPFALSGTIAQTVASGGTLSVTWAATGFADLQWGQKYWVQLRARDTNNVWSSWSDATAFWPDAAPSIPTQLAPAQSAVTTTLPLLTCVAADSDNDSTTGLVVKARIKNASGTVLVTQSMTYNATLARWEYQTTGTDLASFATYKWDAYAGDGILWSGAVTTEASATKSAEATFVYAQGPVLSSLNPADGSTIAVARPTLSWIVTDQQKVRVQIWQVNADGSVGDLVYDTGTWTQTANTWPLGAVTGPDGTLYSGTLRNGNTYQYVVTVTNSSSLTGSNAPAKFTVSLTPPDMITGFVGTPVRLGTDVTETGILFTWNASAAPASTFESYELWRTPLGADGVTPAGIALLLRTIANPLQTAFLDGEPAAGVSYRYDLFQNVRNALDILSSEPATAIVSVDFQQVILSSATDPETYHVDLWHSADHDDDALSLDQDLAFSQPFGATAATATMGTYYAWNPSGTYTLLSDDTFTAAQRWAALVTMIQDGITNKKPTLCYRDGHDNPRYVVIRACKRTQKRDKWIQAEVTFQEIGWTPGQGAAS